MLSGAPPWIDGCCVHARPISECSRKPLVKITLQPQKQQDAKTMNHHATANIFGLQSEETPWRYGRFITRSIDHFGEVTRAIFSITDSSLKLRMH